MSRQSVLANNVTYLMSPDERVAEAEELWAVVFGRLIDEITNEVPRSAVRATTQEPLLTTRVNTDGAICIIARPWLCFPPLVAPNYTIKLIIDADGYLPFARDVIIPSNQISLTANANANTHILSLSTVAGLYAGQIVVVGPSGPNAERCTIANLGPGPSQVSLAAALNHSHVSTDPVVADAFVPLDLGDLMLRRRPILIRGRTVRRTSFGTAAVPNASVDVSGIWRSLADVRSQLLATTANMVGVKPGMYGQRPAMTSFTPILPAAAVGEDKRLTAPVVAEESRLQLTDSVNLVAGSSVIVVDPDDSDRLEQLLVSTLDATALPTDPTGARLNVALRNPHARDSRVVRVTPGAPLVAAKLLTEDAAAGDQTIFLSDIALLVDKGVAQMNAGASVEFQQFARFRITSDPDGYFALPPLHRVAQIEVEATAAGHPPINAANHNTITFQPDYTASENWLNVAFDS